jgi:hypothetical protein
MALTGFLVISFLLKVQFFILIYALSVNWLAIHPVYVRK